MLARFNALSEHETPNIRGRRCPQDKENISSQRVLEKMYVLNPLPVKENQNYKLTIQGYFPRTGGKG